jgi:hypothetical protein
MFGHRFVRRKHELLDQLVSDVARLGHDADDEPFVVEYDVGVGQIEVDRSPRFPPAAEHGRELRHHAEVLEVRPVADLVGRGRLRFEETRHLRVGHPVSAADHAPHELGLLDPPVAVDFEQGRENEAFHPGVQRAEAVRQAFGQHGQHAPRKVDARAPRPRLVVERGAFFDVVRDVRDVDAEPEAAGGLRGLDGVVEVLRGLTVDRHDPLAAEVAPAEEILFADFLREHLGFRDDGLGEAVREVVRPQHDLDVHARFPEEAQALLDDAVRDPPGVRKRGQSRLDDLALPRAAGLSVGDADERVDPRVVGNQDFLAFRRFESPDDPLPGAVEHLDDSAGDLARVPPPAPGT